MKPTTARFVTCNLYLSGNWVRLALKVFVQNDRKFVGMFPATHNSVSAIYQGTF